ncbi:HEAT repeat domain-containing protein [Psychrobacter sp. HD31]|uniref:HEAT repeat domain-containing protein n=1 Tax=Psychrobacter sp. HD31 TaxID=3112003 RepID=UPI003DA4874C
MPIEIFSLSREMEKLYPDIRVQAIFEEFKSNNSAFVRRAMLTVTRFIGAEFAQDNVDYIRESIKDQDEWVAYDAIWSLSENNLLTANDYTTLLDYAESYSDLSLEELEQISPKSADEYRNKIAAEALIKLASK